MTLMSEIERVRDNIAAAYIALDEKGATLPESQNSANLADTIASVPSGGGGEVRGNWVVPPLYLEIDAATDDETNEVYQKCQEYIDENPVNRRFNGIIGFTLPTGYYTITIEFSSYVQSYVPDAILISDGRKIYSSAIDAENGYNSTYTFDFNNMDGQQYMIFYFVRTTQCWGFTPSSAKIYIDSSSKGLLGGYAKYVAIKPCANESSYLLSYSFYSSYYLESFNILGELPEICKASSLSTSSFISPYSAPRYFPPISEWSKTNVVDSYSSSSVFVAYGFPPCLPRGLDISQYTGSSTLQIGAGNTSVMSARMGELYVTLPNANIEFKGIELTQDNWNYLAEHAPTVSGKTLTITGGYIGSSATTATPTAAILGEAYTTFVNKGWTISGLKA